jgi:hypothetical protein
MAINIGIGIVLCKQMGDGGIEHLKVQGLFDSTSQIVSRNDVVDDIEKNGSHYHPLFTPTGTTHQEIGPRIHVVPLGGKKYLRTNPNSTPEDNLGELPECP